VDSTAALAAGKLIDDLLCADGRVKNDWYTRLLQPYSQFWVASHNTLHGSLGFAFLSFFTTSWQNNSNSLKLEGPGRKNVGIAFPLTEPENGSHTM